MQDNREQDRTEADLLLFVAGESPRSTRARSRVERFLEARGLGTHMLEVVDALTEPTRALAHQIIAVPMLVTNGLPSNRSLYGELEDERKLAQWLDDTLRTDKNSITP